MLKGQIMPNDSARIAPVKIRFKLSDPTGPAGETLWAEPIAEGQCRLLSIPFAVDGYAEGDIVRCVEQDGWDEVVGMMQDGGNGTIRLLFGDAQSPDAQHVLDELVSVGCSYESAAQQLVAVTVPPTLDVPFSQLCNFLNETSDDVLQGWEIAKRVSKSGQ